MLKVLTILATVFLGCFAVLYEKDIEQPVLIWSDEFDVEGLPSADKWTYEIGDGCPHNCGFGNNELQIYEAANEETARIVDGHLIIEAHKDATTRHGYRSAKLWTRGLHYWQYGTIEVRAKLPSGVGTWPAIWMMPSKSEYGGWPRSGEIDIMEHVGYNPDSIFGTIHTEAFNHIKGTQKEGATFDSTTESSFHTYKLTWTADVMTWYIDDEPYHSFENQHKGIAEWPFDQPFYLIMNIAVGGNWGGKQGVDENIWPQRMLVDYVRVYK